MEKNHFVVASGVVHLNVTREDGTETGRSIDFNPADQGFADALYGLVSKLSAIHKETAQKLEAETDAAARFDLGRAMEREMRAAVDSLFGADFCRDVFGGVRLFALADGLTVIEGFLFGLLDQMDASITANMAKRDARLRQYTEKYRKYRA